MKKNCPVTKRSGRSKKEKKPSALHRFFKGLGIFLLVIVVIAVGINLYVVASTQSQIYTLSGLTAKQDQDPNYDCALVLGAGIYGQEPSPLLQDRLDLAISLYKQGTVPKIIMSGDHTPPYYNEVKVMKNYAIRQGVPSQDIFLDHQGFSTYESIMRAKEVFGLKHVIIVTQTFHINRAVYLANSVQMDAVGAKAERIYLPHNIYWQLREFGARIKDFATGLFHPDYYVKSPPIEITGNGDATNDSN